MSSADRHHTGSLEQTLQWTLGGLVVAALLALTGAALWIGREGAEQFVASRLAHDAEALIAGIDPQNRKVGGPLPPVYSQPFSGHYYWVRFENGHIARSCSWWDHPFEAVALAPGETALQIHMGPRRQRLLLWRAGYEKQGDAFTVGVAEDLTPLTKGVVCRGIWDLRPIVIGTANLLKVLWIWRVQWMLILRCYRG